MIKRLFKKFNIRRVIPLLSALVVLVCCMVFPASAAPLPTVDYNDLITDVVVDGDNDLVTIVLPLDMVMLEGVDAYGKIIGWCTADHTLPGIIKADFYYIYRISFFNFRLLAEDIPNDTQYTISCEVFDNGGPSTECYAVEASSRESYWDESGNRLYYEVNQPMLSNQNMIGVHSFSGTINKPAGTHALELQQYFWGLYTMPVESRVFLRVDSFILTFSINSLLRLQQTTGKTNKILTEVKNQLAEQGKTLDDIRDQNDIIIDQNDQIINGEVTPEAPEGSDRFDDLDDTEAGLRDDAQEGLETGIEITQNALQIILQYATAFACAGWIFERFSTLPIFTALLFVSMALGVFGLVVNLANDVGRASRTKNNKSGKSGKKGG